MEQEKNQVIASRAFINKGDDKILFINSEAQKRKSNGEKVINASIGSLFDEDGSLTDLTIVNDELKKNLNDKGRSYPTTNGGNDFKNGILKWLFLDNYDRLSQNFSSSVIATPGGTGAISLALRNYTEENQKVLIPSIGWSNYEALVVQSGARVDYYELFENNHFNLNSFKEKVIENIEENQRLFVIINDPCQNPTGYVLKENELKEIISFLNYLSKDHPVVLLMDIAYFDFCSSNRSRLFFNLLSDLNNNFLCLIAFSASKTFSIYGLRLGALIAISSSNDVISSFNSSSVSTARAIWSCPNAHAINTVSSILNDETKKQLLLNELNEKRKMLENRGRLFTDEANEIGLKTFPYVSGFFITIPASNAQDVFEKLSQEGIYVLPMKGKYIRVALSGLRINEVKGLASKIKQYIK